MCFVLCKWTVCFHDMYVNSLCVCVQDFSADFSDLDGVVRQRRQDILDSSSSGSQTPDYEKMAGVYPLFTLYTHSTFISGQA